MIETKSFEILLQNEIFKYRYYFSLHTEIKDDKLEKWKEEGEKKSEFKWYFSIRIFKFSIFLYEISIK